ncbi:MAG: FAD-dependent oxidoreductase [Candidatus Sabulitectum sp.]|nr:FAD-dependent oxidoreductase [Candidatus Sabulitectum sp.]
MKTVIVGAGLSGLTLAERILSSDTGEQVTVLEREDAPGGLARSFHVDGFDFDIGPHRFHTFNTEVDSYLREILADCFIRISRKSSVHMAGKYRNWPLTLASVAGLPFPVLWKSFLDLFSKPDIPDIKSFADFIRSRYGDNLYNFFFSGYTRKFTGIDAEKLHVDWAQAGVNRAVIDNRVKADSLLSLVKGMLLPKPVETKFYYPSHGGIQTFCNLQCERIQAAGGELHLSTRVKGISVENHSVSGVVLDNGKTVHADRVFWTAPITILYPETELTFINTLVANVALHSEVSRNDYQWCYFGHEDLIFSRLTIPRNFRADCVPAGRDSVIAEITCNSESEFWKDPKIVRERLTKDLKSVGAIKGDDIIFIDWQRIPETYPVYSLDYKKRLSSINVPQGLFLTGRSGSFWYNNMDHSIAQALSIVQGSEFRQDFWNER